MDIEQTGLSLFVGLLLLSFTAYTLGRNKAVAIAANGQRLHSHPAHYGWYTVFWVALPALAIALGGEVLQLLGWTSLPLAGVAAGGLATSVGGLWFALRTVQSHLRARNFVEAIIRWTLLAASLVSILTTLGILVSTLFEAIRFFKLVSFWEFITGTQWSPDTAFIGSEEASEPTFGSLPLFAGTFMITAIAMAVAVPIGLLSAIFLSEYAHFSFRSVAKPALEVLAGIPTVVYGFFAAITVSPFVVGSANTLGLEASYTNALAPGLVMGIMIIPLVSSLSDDVITALPNSLREGSYALGTTRAETVRHILLPAALPGVVSAFLLAVSRAVGETMIVVMAAGLRPNLTWNPLEGVTTVTVRIVDALTGDQSFDSPETLSAFGLGLVLFMVTLGLNLVSIVFIRRFRQRYE